ncbi:TPA: conjugal transfer protein [Vibrio cholerae]|uniref:conjugal transfer protein n=1 Tax=Vibrio cholerae TaxID=666 RepID=UPI0012EB7C50|nr:conjugal transfer protein [Vibrio cholerae]HAT7601904.1 conjugal transfer protein [Vibrio cholerae O1]EGQ9333586.1 conjugal transfer protein [Vibrio cholerae]EGR1049114.1 conjugal transfer protein [Vibrio cholerae]EGR4347825.1 conjugal transfer protein [Vibrio cholerae]EKF9578243.1 conjugal transfer protein [Vibrio cholerae]
MKSKVKTLAFMLVVAMTTPVYAAGGLDKATNAVENFKFWLYSFLGVCCFVYMLWQVGLALMDKQSWNDVLMAIGKIAIAGGSILAAEFAWSIWGS